MAHERRWNGRCRSALILAALLGTMIAAGCQKTSENSIADTKARRVTVQKLAREAWSEILEVPATAMGNATVNVVARVPGRIAAIRNDEGAYVKAGDVLVELDPKDLRTALAAAQGQAGMARAGLAAAQVQRDNLAKDHERIVELRKTGSVSQAEADRMDAGFLAAEAQLGVAKAQVEVAQSGLEMARRNLADATVKAPVDGLVVRRTMDVGQETSPAAGVPLVVLSATDPLHVEGVAPEYVLGRLHAGMKATVAFDGLPGQSFDGELDLVGPAVDPVAKMVRVRVRVPNPPLADGRRAMVPGMSGRIRLVPDEGRYFVLPLNAVRRQEGDAMVLLFAGPDDRIEERKVTPLRRDGLRFLVGDDLQEGLRLVVAGPKDLAAGALVEVHP